MLLSGDGKRGPDLPTAAGPMELRGSVLRRGSLDMLVVDGAAPLPGSPDLHPAMHEALAGIDHASSRASLLAERGLLAALGGNCHSPIAVLSRAEGSDLLLRATLFSPDGAQRCDGETRFAAGDASGPRALARDLLARAASEIAVHFTGT